MRKAMMEMLSGLGRNQLNGIVHRDRSGRVRRTGFATLAADAISAAAWLREVQPHLRSNTVGIIGPPSYEWLMMDLACLYAGVKSVAFPETARPEVWKSAAEDTGVSLVLADIGLKEVLPHGWDVHFFGDGGLDGVDGRKEACLQDLVTPGLTSEFTISFSSGTSGVMKAVPISLTEDESSPERPHFLKKLWQLFKVYRKWGRLWFRRDNRLIVFLPFSHFVQRGMVYLALQRGVDLVISSPAFFLRDLIKERPNILVSAPFVFESLATTIRERVENLRGWRRSLHGIYRAVGVNKCSNGNLLNRLFRRIVLGDVLDLLGGRPDYFVSGMAPLSTGALRDFQDAGVRIYQGYGLSETDNISMSTPGKYKLGSVGKPLIPVKIGPESEILVKSKADRNRAGFLQVDEEGYLRTGDIGYLDKDGFLFIRGRKDDLIVLANGSKVNPHAVEDKVRERFKDCVPVAISFDRHVLSVVLGYGKTSGFTYSPKEVRSRLSSMNRESQSHERITRFHIARQPFTVENGMFTAVGKIRRKEIQESLQAAQFESV